MALLRISIFYSAMLLGIGVAVIFVLSIAAYGVDISIQKLVGAAPFLAVSFAISTVFFRIMFSFLGRRSKK